MVRLEFDNNLVSRLKRIEHRLVDRSIRKGVSAAANPLRHEMKRRAPRKTGALRREIRKKSVTEHDTAIVRVGVTYRKNIAIRQRALFQERGTRYMAAQPYVEPTAELMSDQVQSDMRDLIETRLVELLDD